MRLIRLVLEGYKRFETRSTLETDDRLIAIVGPNEAGKSSVLRALKLVTSDDPLVPRDTTMGSPATHIQATFVLEPADLEAIEDHYGGSEVRHLDVTKRADGFREVSISPAPIRPSRPVALSRLGAVERDPAFKSYFNTFPPTLGPADFRRLRELLSHDTTYSSEDADWLEAVINALRQIDYRPNLRVDEPPESNVPAIESLAVALESCQIANSTPHPSEVIVDALRARIPGVVEFDSLARNLRHEYSLDEAVEDQGALSNLAHVADLNLSKLREAVRSNDGSALAEIDTQAESNLDRVFSSERWRQAEIEVRLKHVGDVIQVTVGDRGDGKFLYLNERSAGLQWFVALCCFIERWATTADVVLLIDEAEQHLHYDGQADLVALLDNPVLAKQVIYTTHSSGCLPPDLGRGIRAVVPYDQDGAQRSRIETGFWDEGPGYSRLLLGMGASVLAFSVPGQLLICEGSTEAILLPTLLREAADVDSLGYQVAPGLARTDPDDFDSLPNHAARTAFLADGDSDGERYVRLLRRANVPSEFIFDLHSLSGTKDLNVEELVDPSIYVEIINELIGEHGNHDERLAISDLPQAKWGKAVEAWCATRSISSPKKRVVAQRVVDRARTGDSVTNESYRPSLVKLHSRLVELFV